MAYSTGTDDDRYSTPPYESSSKRAALRYLAGALAGLGGSALRPGAGFGQSLGLGFVASRNQFDRAQQAAMDYAQQQAQQEIQRQNAETQRMLAEANLKKPPEAPKVPTKQQDYENLVKPVDQGGLGMEPTKARQIVYGLTPDETAAAKPKTEKPEKPIPVQLDDGTIVYLPPSQAVGKKVPPKGGGAGSTKPPTEGQANAASYFDRALAADETLSKFEKGYSGMGLGQLWGQYAPNVAKSPERQAYEQAQREFVVAKLRRESGAAIQPSEFTLEAKTLFAQPGDSKTVLDQKAAARRRVIEGLRRSAGPALSGGGGGGAPADTSSDLSRFYKKR